MCAWVSLLMMHGAQLPEALCCELVVEGAKSRLACATSSQAAAIMEAVNAAPWAVGGTPLSRGLADRLVAQASLAGAAPMRRSWRNGGSNGALSVRWQQCPHAARVLPRFKEPHVEAALQALANAGVTQPQDFYNHSSVELESRLGSGWRANAVWFALYEGGRPSETSVFRNASLPANAVALAHLVTGTCVEDAAIAKKRRDLEEELGLEQARGLPPSKLAQLLRQRGVGPEKAAAFSELGSQVSLLSGSGLHCAA